MLDISTCAKQGHSGGMDRKAITLVKWLPRPEEPQALSHGHVVPSEAAALNGTRA
jgi:hypothetical protein